MRVDISKQHEKKDEERAARMKEKVGVTSSKVMLLTVPLVGTRG